MFKFIVLVTMLACSVGARAFPMWGLGAEMESRSARDVNPDYTGVHSVGGIFGKLSFDPWAALLEISREAHDSGSGSLSVHAQTTTVGLWGNYQFLLSETFRPFVSLGLGSYFDQVETKFQSSSASRGGRRLFIGAGGGVSSTLWQHLLLEAEVRVNSIEDSKDPVLSGVLRLGIQI